MTIVLKLPFTSAASTKGRDKYSGSGLGMVGETGVGGADALFAGGGISNVADVGVEGLARLDDPPLCAERVIDRLIKVTVQLGINYEVWKQRQYSSTSGSDLSQKE